MTASTSVGSLTSDSASQRSIQAGSKHSGRIWHDEPSAGPRSTSDTLRRYTSTSHCTERVAREFLAEGDLVLDIAPQDHDGVAPFVSSGVTIETLDIAPRSGATYIADICTRNEHIPGGRFDHIICTEVLEHTLRPFEAVATLYRMLRPAATYSRARRSAFAFMARCPIAGDSPNTACVHCSRTSRMWRSTLWRTTIDRSCLSTTPLSPGVQT